MRVYYKHTMFFDKVKFLEGNLLVICAELVEVLQKNYICLIDKIMVPAHIFPQSGPW
jgi:hypothetical protein